MKRVLIINGHDYYERAQGRLNRTLLKEIVAILKDNYQVMMTNVLDGYDVEEELVKFKRADLIIVQSPIYWFSIPGILKKYIDDVFVSDVFFTKATTFGKGGLFTNKRYMLSLTWGATEGAFSAESEDFLEGLSEDQVLFSVHKTFAYCGMSALPTFSVYESMKKESFQEPILRLHKHLKQVF